jgi:predicted permease
MHTLWQDLRYGLRTLAKEPGFTSIAVLTLALGIGANTALFSVVDAVLLKKLPVKEPDRLVLFNSISNQEFSPGSHNGSNTIDPATGLHIRTSFPYQSFVRLRQERGLLSDLIAFGSLALNVNADGQVDVANGQAVSGNYFAVLGVPPFLGRTINESDDNVGASPVAVLSHRYWLRRFHGNRDVINKQINLNNVAFTIAGVAAAGFEGTMQVGSSQDVYIPIAWEPQVSGERSMMKGAGVWWLRLIGRLKPGATIEQARAGLEGAFQQSVLQHRAARQDQATTAGQKPPGPLDPKDYPRLGADSGSQGEMNMRRFYTRPLKLLFGVVVLVLLIACANVANLLLVRSASRQKEIGVRLAMGASRWRLMRQLLTESVLVSSLGGGLGVLFALWIKDGLFAVGSWGFGGMAALNPRLDWRVLGFTLALSLLTGVVFGLMPALRATRLDLTPALTDTGRSSTRTSSSWLTRSLVVVQVSMSSLLLIGAGLLVRTLLNLQRVEMGFDAHNLLLFTVEPNLIGYHDERLASLYQQISERIEAVPGVNSVTFSRMPLLAFSSFTSTLYLSGAQAGPDGRVPGGGNIFLHQVRENFLEAMGIPVLSGRSISTHDDARAPKVAVINQTFAQRIFPNENPIGKRFGFDSDKPREIEIIGVARDAKYTSQREDTPPTVYLPWLQNLRAVGAATFEVRTIGEPMAAVTAIRQAVREVDNKLPLKDIKTQFEQADETLAMERLFAKLLTLFGLLAQQLASIGLYGVLAYSVSQRTHEIGIRMALGADRRKVLQMIMKQGMALALIGIAFGLSGAYVLTKYLESLTSMLFGVRPADPLTFGAAATLLTFVAIVACFIPARRATKVDPLVALRYE